MAELGGESESFTVGLKYFVLLFFGMVWIGLFPSVILGYWYFRTFPFTFELLYLILLIPVFLGLYGVALLSSLVATKVGIWLVHKRVAYPESGRYRLSMKEPQSRAWVYKANIKHFGRWLFYFFHLEFLRIFWLRRMGMKVGKHVKMAMHLADDEFQEVGDNTFMAERSGFAAHTLEADHLTIGEMKIGKNCIIEPIAGSVQGVIGDNSIFRQVTAVFKGQATRGNAIYQGIPIKKIGENNLTPAEIGELKRKIRTLDKMDYIKQKNRPIKISETRLLIMKILIICGGCLFTATFLYLILLFMPNLLIADNWLLNFLGLALVPIIFIIALGFFVVGTTIFTKIFLVYYDRKAEIPEGEYELTDPRAQYFKIKYLLRLFGLRIFRASLFSIADTFVMRFWGTVKFGKNVELDHAFIDPQYLEVGDNSIIGTAARVHTHDIIDGKLYVKRVKIGKGVLIGTFAHICLGVELADKSIVAVGVWMRKNRRCRKPALWIGKPVIELPLEFMQDRGKKSLKYVD